MSEAGLTAKHGGNYRRWPGTERSKRNHKEVEISNFAFEPDTGRIIDQKTGKYYELIPVA